MSVSLKGFEDKYKNPMLFLFGEDDIHSSFTHSPALVVELLDFILSLECERFIRLFTRGEGALSHCQMGRMTHAHAAILQWLDHVLCGKPMASAGDPGAAEIFVDLFGKHGGREGAAKAKELLEVAHLM